MRTLFPGIGALFAILLFGSTERGSWVAYADQARIVPTPPSSETQTPGGLPQSGSRLRGEDLAKLAEQALKGSADAASSLAGNAFSLGDQKGRIYWLMIGVEDGDTAMRFKLARALIQAGDANDKIRARYWYKRIISEGSPDDSALARRELQAWDEYEEKYQTHYTPY